MNIGASGDRKWQAGYRDAGDRKCHQQVTTSNKPQYQMHECTPEMSEHRE
jgi:hypothetical protein